MPTPTDTPDESAMQERATPAPLVLDERCLAAFDAVPDPVYVVSARRDAAGAVVDLDFRYLNAAALRLYGRDPDTIIGHGHLEVFPSAQEDGSWAEYVAVVESGRTATINLRSFEDHGFRGNFELRAARFGDGVIATVRNMTERVRIEEQLRYERDLNNAILDAAGAIIVVDAGGHIVRFNRQAEAITEYGEADVKGRFYDFLVPPSERDVVAAALLLAQPDQPITQASRIVTSRGGMKAVRWSAVPIVEDGVRTHMVVVAADITAQQQAEQEEAQRAADLERANAELARAYAELERSTNVVAQLEAQAAERQRIAREVNDTIVQGLVAAEGFYDLGQDGPGRDLLRGTSRQAREWVGELLEGAQLQPGAARRKQPAWQLNGASS